MDSEPSSKGLVSGRALRPGLALAAAWLVLYAVGAVGAHVQHASLWFPPAALSFAALLVVGWRAAPWLLLAIIAVTVFVEAPALGFGAALLAGLVFGGAHLACYGFAGVVLRRLGRRVNDRMPLIVIDFLVVAVFGSLVASLLGPLALVATGMLEFAAVSDTWLTFWVGDMVAVIVLAPWMVAYLLNYTPEPRFRIEPLEFVHRSRQGRFFGRLAINAAVISAAMLLNAALYTLESAFAVFLLLLPQMWLTFSEPPRRTAIAVAFNSAVIVAWLFVLDLETFVFVYQFAVAIVATVAFFGVAIPLLAIDNTRLRESVMVDRLTGAASREFLERQVLLELQRAERSGAPLCLLVIDLDHFKAINDELGHAPGDQVLSEVNAVVRRVLRSGDVLARFGGDEFVALLTGTGPALGEDVAERVRSAIAGVRVSDGRPISASIGLTAYRAGDDFARLFERADAALYDAKRAGRDQVRARLES